MVWLQRLLLKSSFFVFFIYVDGSMSRSTNAKRPYVQLTDELLKDYGPPFNRPVSDQNKSVDVEFFLFIFNLNFDERNQMIKVSGIFYESWYDEYLRWNASDFSFVEDVEIPMSQIWHPDITVYNSSDFETPSGHLMTVSSDGRVSFTFPVSFSTFCRLDVRFFPFDIQKCQLRFGSWRYPKRKMDIIFPTNQGILQNDNYVANGIWDLSLQSHRQVKHYPGFGDYAVITITLLLTRRPTFYVLTILIPCVLLSVMNMMVFILPTESGEKVSLGISNVLALVLFQQLIDGILPPTSDDAPLISYYFTPMVITGCLAVITGVVVAYLHQKEGKPQIPTWIRKLVRKHQKKRSGAHDMEHGNTDQGYGTCNTHAPQCDTHVHACDTRVSLCDKNMAAGKMNEDIDNDSDTAPKSAIYDDITYNDVASALNNIMLAVCILITVFSVISIIISFAFMY